MTTSLDALRVRAVATAQEVAAVLGVDERTVRRAVERGELPGLRIGTRVVIPVPRLLAQLEPETSTADEPPGRRDADVIAAAIEVVRGALAALEQLAAPTGENGRPAA